jgi:23S rRNA pseudouridine2605 synthase
MIRLNKLLAERLGVSRRKADELIVAGLVTVNGHTGSNGQQVDASADIVLFKNSPLPEPKPIMTILFNKPIGFVCSRNSQGNNTIYDILPPEYRHLNTIGRLDKDSGGLLVLTNDGTLNQQLAHPSYEKEKVYTVALNKPLSDNDVKILTKGVQLADGSSILKMNSLNSDRKHWQVIIHQGRNRQIRRSFEALGYTVNKLIRTQFGHFSLNQVPKPKDILEIS